MMCRATAFVVIGMLFASSPALSAAQRVEGVVRDSAGKLVAGAQVKLAAGQSELTATTDSTGKFVFPSVSSSSGTITITSNYTQGVRRPWNGEAALAVVLPIRVSDACCETCVCFVPTEVVVVSATRTDVALEDSPADVVVVGAKELASTGALTLDDVLRQVPGFTLFRRSSSRTANPSTQGVSMRGVGASGTSRALVLVDDVPLNDPFGGWVYWDRVVRDSIAEVEVVRGGGDASLYGSTAMGGVIQFRTREPETTQVAAEGSWGTENTPELSLFAGTSLGPWYGSIGGDLFRTNGYIPVPESQRGLVDAPANSRHELTTVELGRRIGQFSRFFARGSYFNEDRHNGTVVTLNNTQLADFAAGLNYETKTLGAVSARVFGLFESYYQTFSSVASDRNSETLTDRQSVPSQALGGSAQWSRAVGRKQTLVAGFEGREVHGMSVDIVSAGTNLSGGRERTTRVFGEDILQLSQHFVATLSLGYDHWSDFDARLIQIRSSGATTLPYAERTSDALNPRAALLYHLGRGTSLTASGYRAFRAPSLNELYRSFRQGNTVTQNNPALNAERLTGVEAGVRQSLLADRLNLRTTFFWNDITDTVENVTLNQTPTLITAQKQNIARTLSTGINVDGEYRVTSALQFSGGYQFAHAVVANYTPNLTVVGLNPSLDGNWIPQVPHQQFTVQMRYVNPKIMTANVQGTFVGQQFDNDLNTFLLKRYFTVDVYLGRSLGHGLEAFLAGENIFDQRYDTALTPVPMLGPPVLGRIGLRYQFPNR